MIQVYQRNTYAMMYLCVMNLHDFKQLYQDQLAALYPKQEITSILQILCEQLLNCSRTDYLINDQQPLKQHQQQLLHHALHDLLNSKPVQYITGSTYFYNHDFVVNNHTLIPRQETEELVHLIITNHNNTKPLNVIDIGTGSGCIGISLQLAMPNNTTTLLDISQQTLDVALLNANQLNARVTCICHDILTLNQLPQSYDLIVSNPPYVRHLEKTEIHDNVLTYEPHIALFVDDLDPLIYYRKIMQLALNALNHDGVLYFEINQYLPDQMTQLATSIGFESIVYKDLNGNHRMMKCWKTKSNQPT